LEEIKKPPGGVRREAGFWEFWVFSYAADLGMAPPHGEKGPLLSRGG